MTVTEAIAHCDGMKPNMYSQAEKTGWLSKLDGMIWQEVILTHEPPPEDDGSEGFTPYNADTDGDTELLVPFPWSADVYNYWLQAQIDKENGEIEKFNQNISMFNAAYGMYTAWYTKTHMPRQQARRWKF